ncbi:MAG: fructosamine kinase family protein [Planctomycetota bacterium]|nr:fructosamine kinase family protein [Planctomycetota bacterium]
MTIDGLIVRACDSILGQEPSGQTRLAGGCMHDVLLIECSGEASCVMKMAPVSDRDILAAESENLQALANHGAIRVPAVLGLQESETHAVLVLESLAVGVAGDARWEEFGQALADLHSAYGPQRYGFSRDNYIGRTPQVNTWSEDWVEFNIQCRFSPQVTRARDMGLLDGNATAILDAVMERLDRFIPRNPPASLLHGDLWSGNALVLENGSIALIDPACSFGDAWADMAMMRLFGGFPSGCQDAWRAVLGFEEADDRVAVYQLYHMLNHLNLFGGSYIGGVMKLAERLA